MSTQETKPEPRRPKLRLPFDNRREDAGEWAFDHRAGLCVTLIAYLLLAIAFVGAGLAEAEAIRRRRERTDERGESSDRKVQGRVTVSFSLVDPVRHARHLVVPAYQCEGGGEVVVRITVNRAGEVTHASVASGGDDCMRETAVRAARNSVFDINDAAPARHTGTITYIFIPQ